jgi:hypothetical protein
MARENPTWSYDRIQGALANLGHRISDTTVGNILRKNGIEPVPKRTHRTTGKTFLQAHWESIAAVDFTTVEVWTRHGMITFSILVAMHLRSRRVEIAGVAENPNGDWTRQMTRNLTDCDEGFLKDASHVIVDRDTKFLPFRTYVDDFTDVEILLLPARSPNLNAHLERYMRSMKSESLDRMIFFGRESLERALKNFAVHYHEERNHQGLENRRIDPDDEVGRGTGEVQCRERLGGMLRYYSTATRRKAAPPSMLTPSTSRDHSALLWHYCPTFLGRAAPRMPSSQIRPRTESCRPRIMLISKNEEFV